MSTLIIDIQIACNNIFLWIRKNQLMKISPKIAHAHVFKFNTKLVARAENKHILFYDVNNCSVFKSETKDNKSKYSNIV